MVSRPIEKSPSNFLNHAYNGGMPIGRAYPRVYLRRAAPFRSIIASHRSVIKNDKGKWDQRRFSRAGQVQITGSLHGVGWKLVLGIEGGAQGNCYTANGFTSACLPPALTLPSSPSSPFVPRRCLHRLPQPSLYLLFLSLSSRPPRQPVSIQL